MTKSNMSVAAAAMVAVLIGLCGCEKQGPMERAGKQIDKAVDKTGQQIEKAGESIQDTAKGNKK